MKKESNSGISFFQLIGSVIYKACVAVALRNFDPQAMKLVTAVLFLVVLIISMDRKKKVNTNA